MYRQYVGQFASQTPSVRSDDHRGDANLGRSLQRVALWGPFALTWSRFYLFTNANKVIARHGGKYLAYTQTHKQLEGEPREVGLRFIIEWPSMEAAKAFESDPEYVPHLKQRLANSRSFHAVIEGTDDLA